MDNRVPWVERSQRLLRPEVVQSMPRVKGSTRGSCSVASFLPVHRHEVHMTCGGRGWGRGGGLNNLVQAKPFDHVRSQANLVQANPNAL